jgi:WD40-like Beta Propeller Repeat
MTRAPAAALALAATLLFWPHLATALHRYTPASVQITDVPSPALGSVRWMGSAQALTFIASGDLVGNGNRTAQLFQFDLSARSKDGLPGITQLTDGRLPIGGGAIAKRGKILAIQSQEDLLGTGAHGWQIFLRRPPRPKIGRGPLVQVTNGPGESTAPLINDAARYLFFQSTLDLTGAGLPPGTYLYRAEMSRLGGTPCPSYPCPGNPGLTLVAPVEAANPVINAAGERVVFESAGDVLGDGSANGSRQLFVRDFPTDLMPAGSLRQLTFGSGDSGNPSLTANGSKVLFQSAADLAGKHSTHTQIFRLDLGGDPPKLTQLTSGRDGDSTDPTVTRAGDRCAFRSTADLLGTGTAGTRQVFLLKLAAKLAGPPLAQLTAGSEDRGRPAMQYSFVVFASPSDPLGAPSLQLLLLNTWPLVGGSAPN